MISLKFNALYPFYILNTIELIPDIFMKPNCIIVQRE